jgi:predicted protein tyrosine phosphatase
MNSNENDECFECLQCGDVFELESDIQEHVMDSSSHMTPLTAHCYVGGCWNASHVEELKRANIDCVISVAYEFSKPIETLRCTAVDFLHYALYDSLYEFAFPKAIQAAHTIKLRTDKNERVLVHCAMGKSRSVMVALVYLVLQHKWSVKQSLEYVKEKRPVAQPNPNYMQQLSILDVITTFGWQEWVLISAYLE